MLQMQLTSFGSGVTEGNGSATCYWAARLGNYTRYAWFQHEKYAGRT
jgi:hypothetical protein